MCRKGKVNHCVLCGSDVKSIKFKSIKSETLIKSQQGKENIAPIKITVYWRNEKYAYVRADEVVGA